jgi:hypothetical protein
MLIENWQCASARETFEKCQSGAMKKDGVETYALENKNLE